jgi:hypothetical protein
MTQIGIEGAAGAEVGGLGIELAAQLGAAVGGLAAEMRATRERRERLNQMIMPLNIDLQAIPASGVLDVPNLLGPLQGWTWQLDAMGAQGFTAGTIGVFENSTAGLELFTFPSAGTFYQRHFRYLRYGQRLIFQATGITGSPAIWVSGIAYMNAIQGEVLF